MSKGVGRDDVTELVSYRTLRRVVGLLGMALPVVVAVWGWNLVHAFQPSISDYYSLRTRDAFVGILFAIAWFLFTYRGYDPIDRRAGEAACACALGVAFFPNSGGAVEQTVHYISATALFLILFFFSFFLFTRSDKKRHERTLMKNRRNVIYRACGIAILVCILLIGAYQGSVHFRLLAESNSLSALNPVFWLEAAALWAFGISWGVKGETVFKDS